MTQQVGIDIVLKGNVEGGKVVIRTLDVIENSTGKVTNTLQGLDKQAKTTSNSLQIMGRAMSGMVAALGVRELVRMADSVTMLRGRLENATRGANEAKTAFDGLRSVAQRTGADMETVVSVFQRLSFVRDEISATINEMLQFTDTVSKLGVISGASQTAMQAGLTQLGQALSANIVRAEEWNSIMENIPAVGVQISKQFGVTTGQLRQLIVEGRVLSEDVFAAMLNASSEVEKQFEKMPMTIGRAFAALRSDIELFVGQTNDASGATVGMIGIIDGLRIVFNGLSYAIERSIIGISTLYGMAAAPFDSNLSVMDIAKQYDQQIQQLNSNWKTPQTIFDKYFVGQSSIKEASESTRRLSTDYSELADKLSGNKDAVKELEKRHKALEDAIKSSRTEEERLLDTIRELEGMRGMARTAKEAQGLEIAIQRANVELDELRIKAERNGAVAKAFESLANQIDDGFRDAFRTAFTESDGGWKSLLNGWKNTFKTFLADLAYMALARPIVISMVGAVGGLMGVSSGAQASILGDITGVGGTGSSGFGLGNLGSIGSNLLNGGLYSGTLGGIGTGIGNMLGGYGYGFVGPTKIGAIGGGAFGNLGYGAIGSLAANLFGLGGGIGGMAGGALGSLAGGAAGTSLGTILGFAGGPIGALAGGFLGSALGGLFGGGKPSDKAQWGSLDLGNLEKFGVGGFTGKKFSQQNADYRDAVLGEAGNLAQLLQSVGGTTSGSLKVYVGSRDGLWLGDRKTGQSFGNNSEAFVQAVLKRVVDQTTGLSDTFETILSKVGVSDTQKLAESFEFGKYYESIINPVDAVEAAIKAVNEQFDALAKQAQDLGLTSAVFTEKLGEQRQAQLDLIKAQQAGFQSLEAMKSTFDSWLYDQSMGSSSTLSPTEKLIAAQGNFNGLLDAIRDGDVSKTQELLQAGQQLLQIGQSMYASSTSFAGLEEFVRKSIGSVAKQLGVPGYASGTRSARAGLAWVGERGPELVRFNGGERVYNAEESKMLARQQAGNDARFAAMGDDMSAMRDDIKAMTRQFNRVATQMLVVGKN